MGRDGVGRGGFAVLLSVVLAIGCGGEAQGAGAHDSSTRDRGGDGDGDGDRDGEPPVDLPPRDEDDDDGKRQGDDCEREVSLRPVTLGEPQPFDLVIVADHSDSLAWSQQQLADGLEDLLTHVQGRTVRVFLLSPTQYGASSADAVTPWNGEPLVAYADPETGAPYYPAATNYQRACTDERGTSIPCEDLNGEVAGQLLGTWEFVMPEPLTVIHPDLSPQEFAAEQQVVTSAILDLEGTGSPQEMPLCTLSRYVTQARAVFPQNAVFLVISDEDDVGLPRECLAGFQSNWDVREGTYFESCESDCDGYEFRGVGEGTPQRRFRRTCMAFEDTGEPISGTEEVTDISMGSFGGECAPRACTESEMTSLKSSCDAGSEVAACEVVCISRQELNCSLRLEGDFVDVCTESFTHGKEFENFAEYCERQGVEALDSCSLKGGFTRVQEESVAQGAVGTTPLVPGDGPEELSAYFRSQADEIFGPAHYLVEGIVLLPEFSCELGPGQSYATNLASMVGDPTRLFPLCGSYEQALQGVIDFAQELIPSEYPLSVADDEHVTAVALVDERGNQRMLSESEFSLDFETQVLSIVPSAIRSSDVDMRVEVTAECEPIVR